MVPEFATSLTDGDFEEALRRLQHSRIQCFALHVLDSRFMRHWSERETDFVVEHIEFLPLDDVDYEALDSAVVQLRPKNYKISASRTSWNEGWNSKQVKLLARDSLLSVLETCTLDVSDEEVI